VDWRRRASGLQAVQADPQVLLDWARDCFLHVQAAWDRADLAALGEFACAPLLQELQQELAQRHPGPQHTEVLELEARLLALQDLPEARVASVEFSGLIRESSTREAAPFKELWLLTHLRQSHQGWRLARVQSLG
jgi:predicted lipid-binding transport protein (Tim44 family)